MMFSPHDSDTLYAAGNVLFKTTDEGQTWKAISGDLTRNIKEKQQSSGGPITQDNTSVEYYGTIFALAESLHEPGVVWTGTDDGLLHVTRDGGTTWNEVTPKGLPREIQINSIEAHPFEAGGLYLAATAYKSDDFRPYLFRTIDYGRSWKKITTGIPEDEFTRVIRADHVRPGLLYGGTERGAWLSTDDGKSWRPLQLNLPVVPVTDMVVKNGDLAVATQGRGYWIFDDLPLLRQAESTAFGAEPALFGPDPVLRLSARTSENPGNRGRNPSSGAVFHYWLPQDMDEAESLELVISDPDGNAVRVYTRKPAEEKEGKPVMGDDDRKLTADKGLNSLEWNLRYPSVERFEKLVLWNDFLAGPRAVPGTYRAALKVGDSTHEVDFEIRADPRSSTTPEELQAQFDFALGINRKLTETHQAISRLRKARSSIEDVSARIQLSNPDSELATSADSLTSELDEIEQALYQTKLEARQDPLNFPIRLNDKLAGVMFGASFGDNPPTASAIAVRDELFAAIDGQLEQLDSVLSTGLDAFNQEVAAMQLPAVDISAD